jgi:hypothetical protein
VPRLLELARLVQPPPEAARQVESQQAPVRPVPLLEAPPSEPQRPRVATLARRAMPHVR